MYVLLCSVSFSSLFSILYPLFSIPYPLSSILYSLFPIPYPLFPIPYSLSPSPQVALDALYDKLSDGGFVIVDDYLIPSCMEAVLDFRAKRGIRDPLWALPGSTKNGVLKVFWQKGHSESGVRGKA